MPDICADCDGEIEIDVTTYYFTWRCKKCRRWSQSPKPVKNILKLNFEEEL